uniref:Uncharacterized protein n=1 Tax=Tanacetum cinerariifolium TaxID=118510 RepID=A0A6L2KQA1_TANCI|nr:hypothetical protein [Tanacetum cinerariifolium]
MKNAQASGGVGKREAIKNISPLGNDVLNGMEKLLRMKLATTKAKNINGEAQIHAKVDGKKVLIFEATIRRDLKFEDEGGVDCLSNEVIFEQLPLMGTMASEVICSATNQKFNFSKCIFDSMVKHLDNETKFLLYPRVIDLENTKTVQAQETSSLKKRVKRLEKKRRLRTHRLKRLYNVSLFARVESSDEESLKDQGRYNDEEIFDTNVFDDEEVVEKEVLLKEAQDVQNVVEKVIEDITTARIKETVSTAAQITTTDVTPDELTMAQALVEIKKSKPKGDKVVIKQEPKQGATTTTTAVITPTPDSTRLEARGVVIKRRKFFVDKKEIEKRNRPPTKAQQRSLMYTYLKNMDGWKPKALKTESFAKIQKLFDQAFKRVNAFVDMDIEVVRSSKKAKEAEDNIWKNQQGLVKVLNWKLYNSCGVYCVTMQNIVYYLPVKKMYLLTRNTLHQMWNDVRLQGYYEVEMAYDLLRLVRRHLREGYVPE